MNILMRYVSSSKFDNKKVSTSQLLHFFVSASKERSLSSKFCLMLNVYYVSMIRVPQHPEEATGRDTVGQRKRSYIG